MAHAARKKALLKKHGLKGVNKPKRTPNHKTKSHMVLAQQGHELKLNRFGQKGVKGAGKNPKSKKDKARRENISIIFLLDFKSELISTPIFTWSLSPSN